MRIALVVSGGFDQTGRERVTPALLWLTERLAAKHDVSVYVLRYHDRPCTYSLVGATVHDLGSPSGIRPQLSALIAAMRRDGPFDVVHGYLALPSGLAAAMAGRRLNIPSVVTFDSGEFVAVPDIGYGLQLRVRHRFAVWTASRLATRATVCTHYQEQLARAHRVGPVVIPMGVDTSRFSLEPSDPVSDRGTARPVLQQQPPRLLHVASLNAVKDQFTLLNALQRVENGHLDIVGEDTLRGAVAIHAERLGVGSRVTFHGFQPTSMLPAFYRRADLFVLSSRHEAANVAVLEAAVCGVPAVGTHVGYLADWSRERAVTVPPGDPVALAGAINSLLADPDRRQRLASAARSWALAHDADWTARTFEELYRALLNP
jgi:glycosyltransferase involved in cell wall biosynthesis